MSNDGDYSGRPASSVYAYEDIIHDVRNGFWSMPEFQRELVWEMKKTAELLDSILKGYPIGTIILWTTRVELQTTKKIGNFVVKDPPKKELIRYVLDGQQRIASIFAATEGLTSSPHQDYRKIYVNLDNTGEDIVTTAQSTEDVQIPFHELINENIKNLIESYGDHIDKIEDYRNKFKKYNYSILELKNHNLDMAVDIFTRINTTGKPLNIFEIMVAKTYLPGEFELHKKFEELKSDVEDSFSLTGRMLLQSLSVNLKNNCSSHTMLKLSAKDIIEVYDNTEIAIKKTVEHFYYQFGIISADLVPYNPLLIIIQYFFFHNPDPNDQQLKMIEEYFWKASLELRFESSNNPRIKQDCERMNDIINNKKPDYTYFTKSTKLDEDYIRNLKVNLKDAICKSIICMLISQQPRDLRDNSILNINNMRFTSNSKNFHRLFSKNYLKSINVEENPNLISNIILADRTLSKDNTASSPEFFKGLIKNDAYDDMLKSHLLNDIIKPDNTFVDYKTFVDDRAKKIFYELMKKKSIS